MTRSRMRMSIFGLSGFVTLAVLGACSNSPSGSLAAGPNLEADLACPVAGNELAVAEIEPGLLPDAATLERWQRKMVDYGPRFTGSDALRHWHDFVAAELAAIEGLEIEREPLSVDWWHHREWSLTLIEDGMETEFPVAAYYPYSGLTDDSGITAELVDVGQGLPAEWPLANVAGKVGFFEVDLLPTTLGTFYANATYVHDPEATMTPATDYTRMSLSILAPQISIIQPAPTLSLYHASLNGASAAIVSFGASFENLSGQYTPFHFSPSKSSQVPTLYVDRATGDEIKARIGNGAQARVRLLGDEWLEQFTDDIIATLPGQTDDVILINTHTDGTSASEENGGLGVLALARYFAALPQHCRNKTMVFVMTPGHFHGDLEDTKRFIDEHPEVIQNTVASLTIEHLGQMEYLDDGHGLNPSGLVEPAVFFGSWAPAIQSIMAASVVAEDLHRVIVSRPISNLYFGVGKDLNLAGVPNAGYLTGPHSLYAMGANQHVDEVDYERMTNEIRTFARVAATMDGTDPMVLCAGMTPPTQAQPQLPLGPCQLRQTQGQ